MALKRCNECGNEVSSKAASCPHCGAVVRRKTSGCTIALAVVLLGPLFLGFVGALMDDGSTSSGSYTPARNSGERREASDDATTPETNVYAEGETVAVGYTAYAVWDSWWSNQLSSNPYLDEPPNAAYLFVELTVQNRDTKARMVPPFALVDENGAEYEASANGIYVDNAIGMMESLNPSVRKQGVIVFDVPPDRHYLLKVSGGYWSADDAFVRLTPE